MFAIAFYNVLKLEDLIFSFKTMHNYIQIKVEMIN